MKRGSKLFFRAPGCPEFGPLPWTKVRDWVSEGFLLPSDEMRLDGDEQWVLINSDPDVGNPKKGFMRDAKGSEWAEWLGKKESLGPRATSYLKTLGCPIPLDRLNRATARNWAGTLEAKYPDRANEVEYWATKEEAFGETPTALPTDPTLKQIKYLRSIGTELPSGTTRRDANRLIGGEATDGQTRRLRFYGIYEDNLSKEEATSLIDAYIRKHPGSEAAYQAERDKLIATASPPKSQRNREPVRPSANHGNVGAQILLLVIVVATMALILKIVAYRSGVR